jgi:pyruvate dehydrogenase E2 component (dihydrolipoamide acetyltransferase)
MPIEIKIPRLGWSMDEGVFSGWLKKDGDPVKSGQPLFTLEGEKASQDVESIDNGKLQIPKDSPKAGETVKVGQVIGYLLAENETALSSPTASTAPAEEKKIDGNGSEKSSPPILTDGLVVKQDLPEVSDGHRSSPRARRLAAELGVDLKNVTGTGTAGRIVESDVIKAADGITTPAAVIVKSETVTGSKKQVSTMRRNIAERTAFSFSNIPHFYVRAEVDVTELVSLREHLVDMLEKECGVRITLTDFLLRAQALALHDLPAANAVWQNNELVRYTDSDVGLVVGLSEGLVIPVIRAAQKLSVVQLAKERSRLIGLVKAGQFNTEMTAGGATSISNLGTTRTDDFAAIIAPHQSSMLAVGRAAPRPYTVNGNIQVRTTIRLCLSADHRVLDGTPAAEFLEKIADLLENPKKLIEAA